MARNAKKKAEGYAALIASCDTGDTMIKNRPRHIKLQGFSGAGKSTWGLTFFAHEAKDKDPASVLMCIIDCDLEGQADLVARDDIVPPALRPRILRKVCRTPDEVNDISMAFIDLMRQHQEEYPDGTRVMVMENEGAYYLSCREHYSVSVHGKTEGELLLSRQQEALSQGKKTLPAYAEGQMHAYKVINKLFYSPYERLKIGGELYRYHFLSTVLLKTKTENYGTPNENRVVLAAGRPDMTDPLFDWIVEMTQQQRTVKGEVESRHFAHIKKSRACKPFRLENPTQERFWKAVEKSAQ
jgi:hypothetical protein